VSPLQELGSLRWQDAVDVAILTLVLFRIYLWLRGTVALQVALGMLTLVLASYAANALGFVLTAYVLQAVGAVAVLVAVVIFREEIRRALTRASPLRLLLRRGPTPVEERRDFTVLAETLFTLARQRLGALVVVPRKDPLGEHISGGVPLGAALSGPLVESIFQKASPLHDGAVVLDGDRVASAGAFLPLARGELPQRYGTRHAAAVGLTELSDALVVAVSEERGEVSIADGGTLAPVPDATALARILGERAAPARLAARPENRALLKDAAVGAVIFIGVVAAWNVVANKGDAIEERAVPVELHGVSPGTSLEPLPAEVVLRLRGPRRLLVGIVERDLHAWADASVARSVGEVPVSGTAPAGVQVVGVTPTRVTLLERRTLRVEAQVAGRGRVVSVAPPEVTLVGKAGSFKGLSTVKTLPIEGEGPVMATLALPAGLHLANGVAAEVMVEVAR
jgi:uncharacterized protein (TIGR00159 family)